MNKIGRSHKILLISLVLFSFLGFADAAYLTVEHYLPLPLPCSLTQGCDVVLHSAYAMLFGIPISLFGAIYYLVVLVMALQYFIGGMEERRLIFFVTYLTGIGLIFSGALVYLQAFVIRQWCMYCLGSATTTLILFILSLFLLSQQKIEKP